MTAAEPGPAPLRRLTADQYRRTVTDLLGPEVVVTARLDPDRPIGGLREVGTSYGSTSARGVEAFEQSALDLAGQAMASPELRRGLLPCDGDIDHACVESFVRRFGRRAYRRPLTEAEVERLTALAAHATDVLGNPAEALELVLAAILQSPHFLWRVEVGEPDPRDADGVRLTGYEIATRLAYFLWATAPDEVLLDAAGTGELHDPDGLAAQVERMLESPRAREGVRALFADAFELYRVDEAVKDPTLFVHAHPDLGASAREETLRVIEDLVFERDGDWRGLLTAEHSFVDRRLAALYGVRAPAPDGFGEVSLGPPLNRRGLLGHASTAMLHSHATSTSATLRGRFVRKVLLCGDIPPPPVNVDTSIPEPSGDAPTLRDRVHEHLDNPACAGCHAQMDPIGLGLERYDAVGRFRETDHGAPIDPGGELDGVAFRDELELGSAVAEHPAFGPCLVRTVWRYATGRLEAPGEEPELDRLTERFVDSGLRVRALLFDVATSPAFRTISTRED